jgi:hypothetical protein
LLLGARNGTSEWALVLLLALYAVAATVWIRGQYADSLESRTYDPPVLTWRPSVGVVTAGLIIAGLSLTGHFGPLDRYIGGLALTGVVLTYFGLGMLITIWRSHEHERGGAPVASLIWLVVGVISAYVGFGVLGVWNRTWTVVLIAISLLVALPVGLQLASSSAIRGAQR